MNREVRTFASELRVETREDESPHIIGHAAVFDSLSEVLWDFRETIKPGAFDGTMEDDVRALWNHDTSHVTNLLGRTTSGTLEIGTDKRGLHYDVNPPSDAGPLLERLERGDVTQSSFGFDVGSDSWDEDDDGMLIRTIGEVDKLYDVSPVVYPAYVETDVAKRTLERAKQYVERKVEAERFRSQARAKRQATLRRIDLRIRGIR